MAYTESKEDAEAYGRELMTLCPKEYAWLVGDCDFDGDCDNCQVPDAPIKSDSKRMNAVEMIKAARNAELDKNIYFDEGDEK